MGPPHVDGASGRPGPRQTLDQRVCTAGTIVFDVRDVELPAAFSAGFLEVEIATGRHDLRHGTPVPTGRHSGSRRRAGTPTVSGHASRRV